MWLNKKTILDHQAIDLTTVAYNTREIYVVAPKNGHGK